MEARLQTIETAQGPLSIEQLSGSGRGQVFQIQRQRTTLGRGENNQVIIQDESVSRLHAVIEQGEDGQFVIFDNQSRNGIRVNGKRTEAAVLQNGDEILIGSVAFRVSAQSPVDDNEVSQLSQVHMTSRRPLNKRLLLYGGAGVVLVAALLMNQSPEDKKSADTQPGAVGGVPQVQISDAPTVMGDDPALRGNTVADVTRNPVEAELENLPWADAGITESETYFRRGQREYFNRNYHRAINSFQLALSLNKMHPAAGYYLKSAVHEAEKEAQKHYEMGLKYFSALQFKRAIYHFQQTQTLLAHKPNDPVISEVEKQIKLARQRLQAAELFP